MDHVMWAAYYTTGQQCFYFEGMIQTTKLKRLNICFCRIDFVPYDENYSEYVTYCLNFSTPQWPYLGKYVPTLTRDTENITSWWCSDFGRFGSKISHPKKSSQESWVFRKHADTIIKTAQGKRHVVDHYGVLIPLTYMNDTHRLTKLPHAPVTKVQTETEVSFPIFHNTTLVRSSTLLLHLNLLNNSHAAIILP